MYRSVMAII